MFKTLCHLHIPGDTVSKENQTNWTPYIFNNELYFICSFQSLCVVKVTDFATGTCEIVHKNNNNNNNNNSKKNNPTQLYGGTNLVWWKHNFFIGFVHTRENPLYFLSVVYDASTYQYVYSKQQHLINVPFHKNDVETPIPYYLKKHPESHYTLSVSHQNSCSIYYEYSIHQIDRLFNSLLQHNICFVRGNDNIEFPSVQYISYTLSPLYNYNFSYIIT